MHPLSPHPLLLCAIGHKRRCLPSPLLAYAVLRPRFTTTLRHLLPVVFFPCMLASLPPFPFLPSSHAASRVSALSLIPFPSLAALLAIPVTHPSTRTALSTPACTLLPPALCFLRFPFLFHACSVCFICFHVWLLCVLALRNVCMNKVNSWINEYVPAFFLFFFFVYRRS